MSQGIYDPEIKPKSGSVLPFLTMGVNASALLGKEEQLNYGARAQMLVRNSTVLVTGAGGSIGSELVRQVTALGAHKVICVDRDEYALYRLQLHSTGQAMLTDDNIILADVSSVPQMETIFAEHLPQLVFHAAACKQLPLLERAPAQAILTNVQGTINIASLAAKYGAGHMVNISTDKAARPVSVLGMTKRIAETATAHYAQGVNTLAASVRFGNVFASRGSFIETLAHQIAAELPVTITDPEMTRFFMTISQAVGLVIEAAVMADNKSIFTLDMGEQYNILSVARRYALLLGESDLPVMCLGRRPGEKLEEELYAPEETACPTEHPSITAISVDPGNATYRMAIQGLMQAAISGAEPDLLRQSLAEVVGVPSPGKER